jgi:2-dehydropantoate 2-reductase
MSIVVFGAGAVGTFFGALLARQRQDVHFIARGAQLDALGSVGARIESTLLGTIGVAPISTAGSAAELAVRLAEPAALVLVCVKAHQTPAILDDLPRLVGPDTAIVTLQNGVESDEPLAACFGDARVYPGVVYVGATVDRPGVVSHVAAGTIALGMRPGGDAGRLARVRDMLAASGQPVRISDDIRRDRWRKLLWNAGFNTVSALTGRIPRDLLQMRDARELLVDVMREVVAVARAQGIGLGEEDVQAQITWTEGADAIRTSTMVDRQRGKEMEIDALIGVIVRRGRELGVPTPRSETVHALLRAAGG